MNTIWKIEQLRVCKGLEPAVEATWLCEVRNSEARACKAGVATFPLPLSEPIEAATELEILQRCYESGVDKLLIEQQTAQLLNESADSNEVVRLPWETAS
jgi:hypothetical protein